MLSKFNLPSNPEVEVFLHEATVEDAIDFSAVDPDCEEEATTLFLSRVQDKDNYSDPREWTGEDRRYALMMYHACTTKFSTLPISFICPTCGKRHIVDITLSQILDTYTPIKGKAYREFVHDGHNIVVYPLNGGDLEALEKYQYDLAMTEAELDRSDLTASQSKALTEDIRRKRVRMSMFRVLCSVDVPFLAEDTGRAARRPKVEEYIKQMTTSAFREFFEQVSESLADMRHGLRSVYKDGRILLEIPDIHCDEHPDAPGVTLQYPFRNGSFIPTL